MLFESHLPLPTKTTRCAAQGLQRDRETGTEPVHILTMSSGEHITIQVHGRNDEVRELVLTAQGSVVMLEDVKTGDAFLIRRTKNVANIGAECLVGENQIV